MDPSLSHYTTHNNLVLSVPRGGSGCFRAMSTERFGSSSKLLSPKARNETA